MRRLRWLAWFSSLLLVAALAVSGAHVHHGPASDQGCVACTLAHAPMAPADATPAVRAPEPACEHRAETPVLSVVAPTCAIPSSRAPPLA